MLSSAPISRVRLIWQSAFRDQSEKSGEAHEREGRKISRMTYLVKNEALNAGVMWKRAPKLGVEYSIT